VISKALIGGLHLALHLLKKPSGTWPGLNPGDEVLTTALTCTATNWPILANGLKPKWVDVDSKTANINLQDLKYKLGPNTKVIQMVHWGGSPVDLDAVKEVQQFAFDRFGFRPMAGPHTASSFPAQLPALTAVFVPAIIVVTTSHLADAQVEPLQKLV
jgi:hypothetical protein